MELLDSLHDVNRLEALARGAGPTKAAWDGLARVYRGRDAVEQELDFLESASAPELVYFLDKTPRNRGMCSAALHDFEIGGDVT